MNIKELQVELEKLGVPRRVYSLKGPMDERLCLESRDGKWYVFFVERGRERILKEFDEEYAACDFMLNELKYEI